MTTKNQTAKNILRRYTGPIGFGEMLKSYRFSIGLNQVSMSQQLGISKQDLCNIENGRKLVSVERAISFANSLSMPAKTFAKYALQDQLDKAGLIGEVSIS